MTDRARRILVRAGKHPFDVVGPEASLATEAGVFSGNVGNFLFSESVIKALSSPGAEVTANAMITERSRVTDEYVDAIDSQFDQFVVPLANAFRPDFRRSLDKLTAVIERLHIPVVVVGVGGQHSVAGGVADYSDELQQSIRRFTTAVLDRSASIGVRGEITKQLLIDLGFPAGSVDIIGCPSLQTTRAPRPVEKAGAGLSASSAIAVNVTPEVERMGRILLANAERYPNMTYIPQERAALALMLWGEQDVRVANPDMPTRWDHPMHLSNRMRFPLDARTWLEMLEHQEFVFGTRLHGNVAGLIAGTPSFLLVHDSRTLELADYHALPHRMVDEVEPTVDAQTLYDQADFSEFNARREETFERYVQFLERNDIDPVFRHPEAQRKWEARHRTIEYPQPVQTLMAEPAEHRRAIAQRLSWLRQGNGADEHRRVGGFEPDFQDGVALPPVNPGAALHNQTRLTLAAQRQLREQQRQVTVLQQQVKQLQGQLKPLTAAHSRVRASLPGRVVRKARHVAARVFPLDADRFGPAA